MMRHWLLPLGAVVGLALGGAAGQESVWVNLLEGNDLNKNWMSR